MKLEIDSLFSGYSKTGRVDKDFTFLVVNCVSGLNSLIDSTLFPNNSILAG